MNCNICGCGTFTKETRRNKGEAGRVVRRRRECPSCGHRFSTKEVYAEDLKVLVQESQRVRQEYQALAYKLERGEL